jgi:hypothetical protein
MEANFSKKGLKLKFQGNYFSYKETRVLNWSINEIHLVEIV